MGRWTFITNHGAVLAYIAGKNNARAIDIALDLGLTERSVRRIIFHLSSEGYIKITRNGRNNCYSLDQEQVLRRAEIRDVKVRELLKCLVPDLRSHIDK